MTVLADLARVIRSKNAKPFYLTLDILFDDPAAYGRVVESGALDAATIARLYRVGESAVRIVPYPAALAVKITLERWVPAASFEDRDILGAQQAVPLYSLPVPGAADAATTA